MRISVGRTIDCLSSVLFHYYYLSEEKRGLKDQMTDLVLYGLRTLAYGSIAASDPVRIFFTCTRNVASTNPRLVLLSGFHERDPNHHKEDHNTEQTSDSDNFYLEGESKAR